MKLSEIKDPLIKASPLSDGKYRVLMTSIHGMLEHATTRKDPAEMLRQVEAAVELLRDIHSAIIADGAISRMSEDSTMGKKAKPFTAETLKQELGNLQQKFTLATTATPPYDEVEFRAPVLAEIIDILERRVIAPLTASIAVAKAAK